MKFSQLDFMPILILIAVTLTVLLALLAGPVSSSSASSPAAPRRFQVMQLTPDGHAQKLWLTSDRPAPCKGSICFDDDFGEPVILQGSIRVEVVR